MANLNAALSEVKAKVERELQSHLKTLTDAPERLLEAMTYGTLAPGKRFRPFLHLEIGRILGVPEARLLRVASAIELVHCYSLIHDDLPSMDNAELRRGKLTTHRKFDEATALLAGNSLLTYAFEILSHPETHPDAEIRTALIMKLAQASGAQGMMAGQMLDLEGEKKAFDLDEIIHMQNLKTRPLISYACVSPAILAQAPQDVQKALATYTNKLGLAFQLADDLLDVEKTAEETGKTTGLDQNAAKSTFVSLLGIEGARTKAQKLIDEAIESLDLFGAKAGLLKEAAHFVLTRGS